LKKNGLISDFMNLFLNAHHEKIRYLVAGAYNTIFGFLSFALLYLFFGKIIHYMILFFISNIIGITNAYISYKFFVFRTRGNYLKEYLRFYIVYGFSMLFGFFLLPFSVEVLRVSPLIAQGIIIIITILISYIGHKNFSFGVKNA